ncbi:hypothetical protein H206_01887 [Candidatus Electrothrix aarhusensis]|uniref:Uncharacterized protein n=1 Tax=Candidatus Electrothrix aarhusensis TaxID=1859131 RepID=A0A444ITV8_9BACT|nr:hypothetical protein H206_01887 [Candidatus Electrothrix aarhusensis]
MQLEKLNPDHTEAPYKIACDFDSVPSKSLMSKLGKAGDKFGTLSVTVKDDYLILEDSNQKGINKSSIEMVNKKIKELYDEEQKAQDERGDMLRTIASDTGLHLEDESISS